MEQHNYFQDLAYKDIYGDYFDVNTLTSEQKSEGKKHTLMNTFPAGAGILLHFVTLGIFTLIHCGIMHDKFPRIKFDDFGSGKAIGFRFIPFFNLYWIFMLWRRLAMKINFQYKLRNQHPPVSIGLTTAFCIMRVIPYVNYVALIIFLPIVYAQIQMAVNQLAMENANVYQVS